MITCREEKDQGNFIYEVAAITNKGGGRRKGTLILERFVISFLSEVGITEEFMKAEARRLMESLTQHQQMMEQRKIFHQEQVRLMERTEYTSRHCNRGPWKVSSRYSSIISSRDFNHTPSLYQWEYKAPTTGRGSVRLWPRAKTLNQIVWVRNPAPSLTKSIVWRYLY